jgi:hypothetical protein
MADKKCRQVKHPLAPCRDQGELYAAPAFMLATLHSIYDIETSIMYHLQFSCS